MPPRRPRAPGPRPRSPSKAWATGFRACHLRCCAPHNHGARERRSPMAVADRTSELSRARRLIFDDRLGEAMTVIDRVLSGDQSPHDRVEALTLRLIALLNMGQAED